MWLWRVAHICRWCQLIVVVVDSWQPIHARSSPSLSTLQPRISPSAYLESPHTHSIPYVSLWNCRDHTRSREINRSHQRVLDPCLVVSDLFQCYADAILHHGLFFTSKSWLDALMELWSSTICGHQSGRASMSRIWLVHCVLRLCVDLGSDLGREDKTGSMDCSCCAWPWVSQSCISVIFLWCEEYREGFMRNDVDTSLCQLSI